MALSNENYYRKLRAHGLTGEDAADVMGRRYHEHKPLRYRELFSMLESLPVGQCLQWDIPGDTTARRVSAAITALLRAHHSDKVVRMLVNCQQAFFVRIK